MNVVDSSGWLEYFADGPNADFFAPPIEATTELIVPSVSLCEVFKRILQQRGEGDALLAVAAMQQGSVVPLDEIIALEAARLSAKFKLSMADSLIFATAQMHDAVLWTQEEDFENMASVRYIEKHEQKWKL